MQTTFRNILIIISPFLIMLIVNEISRKTVTEKPYLKNGITAINSSTTFENKCSWQCHNNTAFCMQHHVKSPKYLVNIIKPFYFGMISALGATGGYALANIIFLVVLWPIFMFVLFIKVLDNRKKLSRLP